MWLFSQNLGRVLIQLTCFPLYTDLLLFTDLYSEYRDGLVAHLVRKCSQTVNGLFD